MKQVVNYIVDTQQLDIDYLVPFQGQAKDLSQKNRYKLRKEILDTGFSFAFHVWKTGSQYFIIDGHQRLSVLKNLRKEGYEVPLMTCNIITADSIKEAKTRVLQAISQYGKLNKTGLAEFVGEDFDDLTMDNRFDFPDFEFDFDDEKETDDSKEEGLEGRDGEIPKDLIDPAWRQYAKEIKDQYDCLEKIGHVFSGLTTGLAKISFLKARFNGSRYLRYLSLAFHPQQFKTPGDAHALYDVFVKTANGEMSTNGIKNILDGRPFTHIYHPLPVSGHRVPADFPAELARDLISKYASGGSVLDPCHGWGGRLVGFLLSKASQYHGVDASDLQSAGVKKIKEAFLPLSAGDKIVDLECIRFQDVKLNESSYDFAITSPPYFDVEKYLDKDGEQSWSEFDNYESWRDGFYQDLISKTYTALKEGGHFALQVGSQAYPLIEDGIKIAKKVGFKKISVEHSGMDNTRLKTEAESGENVIIFKKIGR